MSVEKSYSRSISEKICCTGNESSWSTMYSAWIARKTAWSSPQRSTCSGTPRIYKTARSCGSCYLSWSKFRCPKMWSKIFSAVDNPAPWRTTNDCWNCAGCFYRGRALPPFRAEKPHWRSFFPWSAYLKAMWQQYYGGTWRPSNIACMCR